MIMIMIMFFKLLKTSQGSGIYTLILQHISSLVL